MPSAITILIIGDVVGKLGRRTIESALPGWREQYQPDAVICNVENLAHGKGITTKTLTEMRDLGIDAFTAGDHIWAKQDPSFEEVRGSFRLALPANDPRTVHELRWQTFEAGGETIHLVNLIGRVFMNDSGAVNPFSTFDALYTELKKPKFLIVDLHAEATSEKVAFGLYADGRASIVVGTHTHIPTADERILDQGTGYLTDVGMTGSNESVLGVAKEVIIDRFLETDRRTFQYPETGRAWINGALCSLDRSSGKCLQLERLQETLTIK